MQRLGWLGFVASVALFGAACSSDDGATGGEAGSAAAGSSSSAGTANGGAAGDLNGGSGGAGAGQAGGAGGSAGAASGGSAGAASGGSGGAISGSASLVLDTSHMTVHELRDSIRQKLLGASKGSMSILVQSFGFKRGVPVDADLVFDVRMLPNPYWVSELRRKSGLDAAVRSFLESHTMTGQLYDDICHYLDHWLPHYRDSNRSYMTVAVGCTGGQHRSVYLADRLFRHYREQFPSIQVRHRELQ